MSTLQEWIIDIPAIRAEAKAFWGDEWVDSNGKTLEDCEKSLEPFRWTNHSKKYLYQLEHMLKSDNPVEYYEQHKPKGK